MANKTILVTGGLGYIGSHTVVDLQNEGFDVVIIDDLSNTNIGVLKQIESITGKKPVFEQLDLKSKTSVKNFFSKYKNIDGVIHFAAYKAVGESVEKPLDYYHNNIVSLIFLLEEMRDQGVNNFIFSSSCTVYGQADKMPITENTPLKKAESPYGNTKKIGEEILIDFSKAYEKNVIALRYFNPIGAHDSIKIGELPLGTPQNLIPFITQTAVGKRQKLSVFGDDYPTPDGTAIRDYIYVNDLAKAHTSAIKRLLNNDFENNFEVYNLGTGMGSSVMEIIKSFEKTNNLKLNYTIAPRREGDITQAYACTKLANKKLNWKAKTSLEKSLETAWLWEKKQK